MLRRCSVSSTSLNEDSDSDRSFTSIGPSHWNALSPSVRSTKGYFFFQEVFRLHLPLSNTIFSHGALRTGSASERFTRSAIQNNLKYNTISKLLIPKTSLCVLMATFS